MAPQDDGPSKRAAVLDAPIQPHRCPSEPVNSQSVAVIGHERRTAFLLAHHLGVSFVAHYKRISAYLLRIQL